jgi:hypothetical protein
LSGYVFSELALRDASDFTRTLREQKVYANPVGFTNPRWTNYSPGYVLQYQFGRYKCTNCVGNAFVGNAVEDVSGNVV